MSKPIVTEGVVDTPAPSQKVDWVDPPEGQEALKAVGAVEMDTGDPSASEPEPERPRAWIVAYGAPDNSLSMVGNSQLEVVKMIEGLKAQFHACPGKFAPFQVLNHGSKGGVETAWLIPSLMVGVFHQHVYPQRRPRSAGGLPEFFAELQEAAARSGGQVILGQPPAESEEDLVIEVDPPKPDNDDGGGPSGAAV